ncbi:uncharacterized protein LOC123377753 isoform X2 [Mauremys mutica]|uniref:uncharacterized protein LOC123377753 isoform X2 n=1 Tax=Mauremys mutica TaxID=74926 RepID=UPI001D163F13|nr:uncharacterized protein LOC123377753 isoform X2 [Mauremys mutica]
MDAAALFQGPPEIQRRRNGWTCPQMKLLSRSSESSFGEEKRMRGSSSCSCRPSTQAAVVERSVELIEELPKDSPPSAILANSLVAVGNLSTMKPALEPDLETHLLRAALRSVFTLGMEKGTINIQALHKVMPELLDAMLGNLLAESPDADRLHYILEG